MIEKQKLADFLAQSLSSYHAAAQSAALCRAAGGTELFPGDAWTLEPSKLYFLRSHGLFMAFRPGTAPPEEAGFAICAAHTDSPSLKLKFGAGTTKEPFLRVPAEVYGGAILSTWLDRDLSVAGLFCTDSGDRLYHSDAPVAVIPNLAIHLNRKINEGYSYNEQEELQALFYGYDSLEQLLADDAGGEELLSADLFLCDATAPCFMGDFFTSGRIDNLASCYAGLMALCSAEGECRQGAILLLADAEEVGSRINSGADSAVLPALLRRIASQSSGGEEAFWRALSRSFLISADGAHAAHPNYVSKHDPDFAPRIGGGPVIKNSASYRYATRADSAARFIRLCKRCDIGYQELVSRSDMKTGSTVGSMLSAALPVSGVDVGIPMLAMHSIRESAAFGDISDLYRLLLSFYQEGVL